MEGIPVRLLRSKSSLTLLFQREELLSSAKEGRGGFQFAPLFIHERIDLEIIAVGVSQSGDPEILIILHRIGFGNDLRAQTPLCA
jgi:hypothetical protein